MTTKERKSGRIPGKLSIWKRFGDLAPLARELDYLRFRNRNAATEEEKEIVRSEWQEAKERAEQWCKGEAGGRVWRGLMSSVEKEFLRLTIDEFFWKEEEARDFLALLESFGITEFVFTDRSTAVMNNLHYFDGYGWKVAGCITLYYRDWGRDQAVRGLEIKKAKKG